ncbi:8415_t:CDS:2 [Cetraspora pellucida]|uniref:8415_t:CDS:1 n=1 Tax=Cetraspora pellucida TaxID=1433469 RepID=A0A9N9K517_9GLOM|nr:8415_t:CDS:2 [Cetraspora pellucida]
MNESVAEPEVLDSQATELEMLDRQDVELEVLATYDNMDNLFDIDNLDDDKGLFVSKTFEDWDQVANFMKKYVAAKVNAENQKVIKWTYLCCHAGKPVEKSSGVSCQLPKDIVEEIHFLTIVAKANATMQYRIIQEKYKMFRRDSVPGKDDAGMLLKRLNEKKIEDPQWAVSMEFDPVTSSLTHLFCMSPEQQIF